MQVTVINLLYLNVLQLITTLSWKQHRLTSREVNDLTEALRPCTELTCLTMTLAEFPALPEPGYLNSLAESFYGFLTRLTKATHLTMENIPMAGYAGKYILPPLLKELNLHNCSLMYTDWEFWANNCKCSIERLVICKCPHIDDGSSSESLLNFIKKQSRLTSLTLDLLEVQPSTDILRRISVHLAKCNTIEDFTCGNLHREALLYVMQHVIPWLWKSEAFESFLLFSSPSFEPDNEEFRNCVRYQLLGECAPTRRSLLLGTVRYQRGFHDNNALANNGAGGGGGGNEGGGRGAGGRAGAGARGGTGVGHRGGGRGAIGVGGQI